MKLEKRTSQSKVKGSNKQLAETQKIFDITRVQQYDIQYLLCFDLIDNSYLFDHEGLMKKTCKSELCTEMEKVLHKNVYVPPSAWNQENTAAIVHVMGCLRRLRLAPMETFNDFSTHFLEYIHGIPSNSNRIDFVFDTYIEGSIKDSERERRCKCSPIDLNEVLPSYLRHRYL